MAKKENNELISSITLTKKECLSIFEEEAKKTAQAVCGCGQCFCGYYNCGHPNVQPIAIQLGKDIVCPIAHYGAKYDPTPWYERMGDDITLDGLFAVCACCNHTVVTQVGEEMVITYTGLEEHCLDCPIHIAKENIMESMAEAGCS